MADVTISGLDNLSPAGSNFLPISNGSTTGKTTIASLPVEYSSITNKPESGGQLFVSNGTFTVPQNVTKIKIHAIGGGGGGGGSGGNGGSGGSSSVEGSNIVGGGGGCPAAGVASGSNTYIPGTGNSGGSGTGTTSSGTPGIGAQGFRFYGGAGNIYGGGGSTSGTGSGMRGGGSGGYAVGVVSVTPGSNLSVTVGQGGTGGSPGGGTSGSAGAVLIEW